MLVKRVLVSLVLLPVGLIFIYWGGWAYAALIALIIALAAWEYANLFRAADLQPAAWLVAGGAALFVLGRAYNGFASAPWIASLIILGAMTVHLVAYERGRDRAATDFAVTLSGAFYLGWIGAYLVSLRGLPQGMWWVLTALPAVWLADSGAYLIGRKIGKHKMTRRLSPKKSWEGYFSGVVFAVLFTPLLVLGWQALGADPALITLPRAALTGLVLGSLPVLGDLGESMIKRQVGIKDSGNLLPGHGGAFDRIDSWLWAGVLGYYLIAWFFI